MFEGAFWNGPDRYVSVQFVPGWGEPGQYYIKSTKYGHITVDLIYPVIAKNGQAALLDMFLESYRPEIIANNWERLKSAEDIALYVVDALDMDTDLFFKYLNKVRGTQTDFIIAMEKYGATADRMSIDDAKGALKSIEQKVKKWEQFESTFGVLIKAYDIGSGYGLGWNNETFVRDFPEHPLADLAREEINARSQQDSTNSQ